MLYYSWKGESQKSHLSRVLPSWSADVQGEEGTRTHAGNRERKRGEDENHGCKFTELWRFDKLCVKFMYMYNETKNRKVGF